MTTDRYYALKVLSEVINNRPEPLREFDQIFMKAEDIVEQAALLARTFDGLNAAFIGDGDSIALAMIHLSRHGVFAEAPKHIRVLDFDERIVNAINGFADAHGYSQLIEAELYNVADPLPQRLISQANAFYTNPPWGASNRGESVIAFMQRGIECVGGPAMAAVVVANEPKLPWTQKVLSRARTALHRAGFVTDQLGEERRHYHLDDDPNLRSCTLVAKRVVTPSKKVMSRRLRPRSFRNFYGRGKHLRARFILENDQQGVRRSEPRYGLEML